MCPLSLFSFDIFSLGLCERQVHSQRVSMLDGLKSQITAATENFMKNMLQHVWQDVDYRCNVCRATDGAHCEAFSI
jgi:hypothetical protein